MICFLCFSKKAGAPAGNEPFRAFLDAGGEYTAGLAGTAQAA